MCCTAPAQKNASADAMQQDRRANNENGNKDKSGKKLFKKRKKERSCKSATNTNNNKDHRKLEIQENGRI